MSGDDLDAIRARLRKLTGPARTRSLLELTQVLADQYWRRGLGRPDGLPYLDEEIAALTEAYRYFADGDVWRGRVASELGWVYGVRFLAHAGAETDRDAGIPLLEEALAYPGLPPILRDKSALALGQLYLSRAIRVLQSPDVAAMLLGSGLPPRAGEDCDRAADLFRKLLAAPAVGADAVEVIRVMLTVAEAFKSALASAKDGAAGFDLTGMMRAMSALQDLQRAQNARPGYSPGALFPAMRSVFDADALAALDPEDRPVMVVDAAAPAQPPVPATPRPEPIVPDRAGARRELRTLLAPDGKVFAGLAALLGPDGAELTADDVHELVAPAVLVASGPDADGTDHLILAAALYLRGRLDTGTWRTADGADLALSHAELAIASPQLRTAYPESVPALNRLTALLNRARTAGRASTASGPPGDGASGTEPRARCPVFVADPRGDRAAAAVDAMLLRRAFYPAARGLGDTGHGGDRPATPDAVLAALDTPMLQLSCGVTRAGSLKLADATELPPERLRAARNAGGLAVLPPTGVGLAVLGDALLAAGFADVVTWKRVVPVRPAALMLFVLHAALVDDRLAPAKAVDRVRDWMRDPHRIAPAGLPDEYAATFARRDLADEAYWGALVHRDR